MKHDVFISHSSKDFELANAICEHLELNKVNVWIAPRDLVPGNSYPSEIINGIKESFLVASNAGDRLKFLSVFSNARIYGGRDGREEYIIA